VDVSPRVRIDPIGERYFVADRRFRALDPSALRLPRGDEVYPPSSDSMLLADVVRTEQRRSVLDLCTGSGIQAVAQAQGAEIAIAVDVNPRAVAVARLNAQLNGALNVEVRQGDLYGPVRGQRFDLIVANPPFVSSPYQSAPSFHSGGPTGDRVLRRVIRGWSQHLEAGGRAFAVSHVGVRRGEEIDAVARSWFEGFSGQALVLVCETGSAVDLAAAQALFALRRGLDAYRREVERWHQYLRRHRIASVSLVLIAARQGEPAQVEVVDAHPRVLPLPLAPGPAERIDRWLVARRS
jgi:carbamoyltransferase